MNNGREDLNNEIIKKKSMILAMMAWLFSIFFTETFLKGGFGLSTPIVIGLLIGILLWYYGGGKLSSKEVLFIVGVFIMSLSLFITYSFITYFISFLAFLYLIPALVATISGYNKDKSFFR